QGPLGQPRAPMSQPNANRARGAGGHQPGGWSPDGEYGGAPDGNWGMPGGAGRAQGQDVWGAPQQPYGAAPAGWGEEPAWGRGQTPAMPGMPGMSGMPGAGPAQNGWDAPQGAPMAGGVGGPQDGWGQQSPQGGWGAPPTTPRG